MSQYEEYEKLLVYTKNDNPDGVAASLAQENVDINQQDGLGNTALHYAAATPCPDALGVLLDDERIDVNITNRINGQTPLHAALTTIRSPQDKEDIVTSLVVSGVDPNIKDKQGHTALDYAVGDENAGIRRTLEGAQSTADDAEGEDDDLDDDDA